jgi:hypothetical protein
MTHRLRAPVLLRLAFSLASGLALGGFVGCEQEEEIEARLCQRLDECNYFGPGVSVDDCTDVMTMCSDSLVTSQRTDWSNATEDALEMANCDNFLLSYERIGVCSILGDGSIDDDPGPAPGDDDGPAPGDDDGPQPGDDGPMPACTDEIACLSAETIEVCDGGQLVTIDCEALCIDGGYAGSDDCSFDAERGHDVCWCVDMPAPPPPN